MLQKIKSTLSLLFSKGVEGDTEENRAFERKRRITQTAVMGLSARAVNIISGLVTIPLTLPYLGIEQFGIWMTLTGFISFLSFTDLGISVGLQSRLTNCHGRNDQEKPSYFISSALALILFIASILIFVALFILPNLQLSNIIKLTDNSNKDILLLSAQSFIITFAVGLPSGLIQRTFEAYQDGFTSNSFLLAGRILSFLSVFICVHYDLGLPLMIALYMGFPFILLLIGGIWLFIKKEWLRPNLSKFKWDIAKQLMQVGGLALSVQIGFAVMMSGPLLVLVSKYGAAAVVPFTISQRIFSIVSLILGVILNPLWPAYGEAIGKGDWNWVAKTFKRSFLWLAYLTLPIFVIFTIFGQEIILLWTQNEEAVPSWTLLMICNLWMILMGLVRVLCMFLNGVERFEYQAVYNLIFPVLGVFIGWYFSDWVTLAVCLAIMIFIGETSRIVAMIIESLLFLKKRMKNFAKS